MTRWRCHSARPNVYQIFDSFGICVAAIQEQVGDACLWEGIVRAKNDSYPGCKIGNCVSLSAAMDEIERELCQHWPELAQ